MNDENPTSRPNLRVVQADYESARDRLKATIATLGQEFVNLDRTLRHRAVYASHYRRPAPVKPNLRRRGWRNGR